MTTESSAGKIPSRIETILFDAGGVLVDVDLPYVRRLVEARRIEVTIDQLTRAEAMARLEIHRLVSRGGRVGQAWRDFFRLILADVGVGPGDHEQIIDSLWEAHQRFGLWTVGIPGVADTIRGLRDAGYRIGVVSNAEGRVEQDLYGAGYDGLLDVVVDSHVVGVEKPDPAIFAIAIERLEAQPETTIHVGDIPSVDVEGARAAGICPILVDPHGHHLDCTAPRIASVNELPALLKR